MLRYFDVGKRISLYLARISPQQTIDHLAYEITQLIEADDEPMSAPSQSILAVRRLPRREEKNRLSDARKVRSVSNGFLADVRVSPQPAGAVEALQPLVVRLVGPR